jgi:hypothetical protein
MLLEIAKPVALLFCLLSLYALFHTAFLMPGTFEVLNPGPALQDRIIDSLTLFALATGICVVSGLIFRESTPKPHPSLSATLPLQLFYWATGIMLFLFIASWYLETHCIFYRSTIRW